MESWTSCFNTSSEFGPITLQIIGKSCWLLKHFSLPISRKSKSTLFGLWFLILCDFAFLLVYIKRFFVILPWSDNKLVFFYTYNFKVFRKHQGKLNASGNKETLKPDLKITFFLKTVFNFRKLESMLYTSSSQPALKLAIATLLRVTRFPKKVAKFCNLLNLLINFDVKIEDLKWIHKSHFSNKKVTKFIKGREIVHSDFVGCRQKSLTQAESY